MRQLCSVNVSINSPLASSLFPFPPIRLEANKKGSLRLATFVELKKDKKYFDDEAGKKRKKAWLVLQGLRAVFLVFAKQSDLPGNLFRTSHEKRDEVNK